MKDSQFNALLWIGRVTSFLSIVGSGAIIFDVLRRRTRRSNNRRNYNFGTTIILLMSIFDAVYSFVTPFLGTLLVPKSTGFDGAIGNKATCTFQGFCNFVLGGTANFYNATLAIYFMLTVRFQWKEAAFKKAWSRFWFLGFPFLFYLLLSVWPLTDDAFDAGRAHCYLANPIIDLVAAGCYLVFTIIIVAAMGSLWLFTKQTESRSNRYSFQGSSQNTNQSKRVARLGIMYGGCYVIVFWPYYVLVLLGLLKKPMPYWILVMAYLLIPLQGFFNAFVYFNRIKIRGGRRNSDGSGFFSSMKTRFTRQSSAIGSTRESGKNSVTKDMENAHHKVVDAKGVESMIADNGAGGCNGEATHDFKKSDEEDPWVEDAFADENDDEPDKDGN